MEANESKNNDRKVKQFLDKHFIVKLEGTYAKGNVIRINYFYWQNEPMKSSPMLFNIPKSLKYIELIEVIEKTIAHTGYEREQVKKSIQAWLKKVSKSCLQ